MLAQYGWCPPITLTSPNLQYPPDKWQLYGDRALPKARFPKQKVGHRPTCDAVRKTDPIDAQNIVKRPDLARVLPSSVGMLPDRRTNKRTSVAHPARFELTTSAFGGQRSIQLSYGCRAWSRTTPAGWIQRESDDGKERSSLGELGRRSAGRAFQLLEKILLQTLATDAATDHWGGQNPGRNERVEGVAMHSPQFSGQVGDGPSPRGAQPTRLGG